MEEIREAARIACIDDAIMSFPDGYETLISRRISDRKVIIVDSQEFSFSNQSMVRIHVH